MQAEADVLAKLCDKDHVKEAYKTAFSEELDAVTLVHGDLWSTNMMFRVRLISPCPIPERTYTIRVAPFFTFSR